MPYWNFWTKDQYQHTKELAGIIVLGAAAEGILLLLKYLHAEEAPETEEDILFAAIPAITMSLAVAALRFKYWREEQDHPYQPVHDDPFYAGL